jgi:hypothetical protein
MEAMENVDFRTAEPDEIVATLLHRGCVLLRNFVDTAALARAYDVMVQAYEQVEIFHIQPDQLRQFGLPVNFWLPFQECGVDAPSLGVVEAPFADIVSFTGYENGAEVWADPAPVGQFTRFRPAMQAMCRYRDAAAIAEMRERFDDSIRTPSFVPGDAMMLSNWTLHLTHATPDMTKTRENLELRFWSPASLDDILREHGIASA